MGAPGSTPPTNALVGDLNVQVQQQQQSSELLAAVVNSVTNPGQSAVQSTSGTFLPVNITPTTFSKSTFTFDRAWHTLNLPNVPQSAKWVLLNGIWINQGSTGGGTDNKQQTFTTRAAVNQNQFVLSVSNGVAGNYENDGSFLSWVPVSGGQIDYMWGAEGSGSFGITSFTLTVVAYSN